MPEETPFRIAVLVIMLGTGLFAKTPAGEAGVSFYAARELKGQVQVFYQLAHHGCVFKSIAGSLKIFVE